MKSNSQREFDATFGKKGLGVCSPDAVYVAQGPPRCPRDLIALSADAKKSLQPKIPTENVQSERWLGAKRING